MNVGKPSQSKPAALTAPPKGGAFCGYGKISGKTAKLAAVHKSSPFGGAGRDQPERTERVRPGDTPSVKACGFASSPKGTPFGAAGNFAAAAKAVPLGKVAANAVSRRKGSSARVSNRLYTD